MGYEYSLLIATRRLASRRLGRVGVEANLQELQPVVVVLPEEALEACVEDIARQTAAAGGPRRRFGHQIESDRRESSGHVPEAALARPANEDLVQRRADGDAGVDSGERDVGRAGGDLGAATRLAERARPDRVAAGRRKLEGSFPIRAVLVEDLEGPGVGALTEENLRGDGDVLRPEVHEDDVAAPRVHVGTLVVRHADDVEIVMRSAGRAVAGLGLERCGCDS